MNIKSIVFSMSLLLHGLVSPLYAVTIINRPIDEVSQSPTKSKLPPMLQKVSAEFLYSYTDFNFHSSIGTNFNNYKGHANLYGAGADRLVINPSTFFGVYVFNVQTDVTSQAFFAPTSPTATNQQIRNNTLFLHLNKHFSKRFYIDLGGAYGQNKVNAQTLINPNTTIQQMAFGSYNNNNWFTSLNANYLKPWNRFLFKFNLGVLYSQIQTGAYFFGSASTSFITVQPLTNTTTLIMENVEAAYKLTSNAYPFVNVGLIEVAGYHNSRPVFVAPIIGSLPQLNLNHNGYRLGGGLTYRKKQFTMRLEEKYYSAGNFFNSYQTQLTVEYLFG